MRTKGSSNVAPTAPMAIAAPSPEGIAGDSLPAAPATGAAKMRHGVANCGRGITVICIDCPRMISLCACPNDNVHFIEEIAVDAKNRLLMFSTICPFSSLSAEITMHPSPNCGTGRPFAIAVNLGCVYDFVELAHEV